jgi:hypothetical protein
LKSIFSIDEIMLCKVEFAAIANELGKKAANQIYRVIAVLALMSHCKIDVRMDSDDADHLVYCCGCPRLSTIFYRTTRSVDSAILLNFSLESLIRYQSECPGIFEKPFIKREFSHY